MFQRRKHYITVVSVIVTGVLLVACGSDSRYEVSRLHERTITILATTGMIADLAKNICGTRAEVTALMGPGVDPHLYKASEGDVRRMGDADIILYNGLHLEGAMSEVLEKVGERRPALAVAAEIEDERLLESPDYAGQFDPHIWFDVSIWIEAARGIQDLMVELDSVHADTYKQNTNTYIAELQELHRWVQEQTRQVPSDQRVLITAHDAFNYFGRAYGFEVRGLQGISTATEAGTADVQSLAGFIAERRIPAMFVESSVSARSINAVQAAVRSRGFNVTVGGELFSDAMGTAGTPEGTYVGMVRHNVATIVTGLLADDPELVTGSNE